MCRTIWILIICLATGCAPLTMGPQVAPPPDLPPSALPADVGWWAIRFRMDRPDGKTLWQRDLLIAHRIMAPILRDLSDEIELWRFHRRATDDGAGHQFSFLFFAGASVAQQANDRVADDPLVRQMVAKGWVKEILFAHVDRNERPNIGDTSDPKWSAVMKDNWPYFIMGVSRMWLGMIDQVSRDLGMEQDLSGDRLVAHYARVNEEITKIWQQEGYHALLHHLNAIYGYEAMVYWERRWKAF